MSRFQYESPERSLRASLNLRNADDLKQLLPLIPGVKLKAARKGDIIEALERCLLGPAAETVWRQLDPLQQMAVTEAVHTGEGLFDADGFRAKHGGLPKFTIKSGKPYPQEIPTHLRLFIHSIGRWTGTPTVIPDDLRNRLLEFVPEPPRARLAVLDELPKLPVRERSRNPMNVTDGKSSVAYTTHPAPLIERLTEQAAIQDLRTVLRLVEQEKLCVSSKTLRPSKATLETLEELLCGGDFYEIAEPENKWDPLLGAIKCFAWPLLVQAAKLARAGTGKMTLTKSGRAALGRAPEETFREIWQRWMNNKLFDEFNRVDTIKGQTGKGRRGFTAPQERRMIIEEALSNCPTGKWIEFDEFSRYMRADGLRFDVHSNRESLYLCEHHYGNLGYGGCGGWNILQERYMLCLLFEYAAPLGIIDLAYTHPHGARTDFHDHWGGDDLMFLSRYDGLKYFRLTPLGAFILGKSNSFQPAEAKPELSLTIHPNRSIHLKGGMLAPDELLQIESYADPVEEGQWLLNEARALKALEKGASLEQFRQFLEARDPQPLPETVLGFLAALQRKACALASKGTALLIECDSVETAETVATNLQTRGLCQRTGEKGLVVPIDKEQAFRTALNSIGYGMPIV